MVMPLAQEIQTVVQVMIMLTAAAARLQRACPRPSWTVSQVALGPAAARSSALTLPVAGQNMAQTAVLDEMHMIAVQILDATSRKKTPACELKSVGSRGCETLQMKSKVPVSKVKDWYDGSCRTYPIIECGMGGSSTKLVTTRRQPSM